MIGLLAALFWASAALLVYAVAGFPLLLAVRSLRPRPAPRESGDLPRVSYVIVAHNEIDVVDAKFANTAALDYPPDRLEVVFASDGSDDGTDERVEALCAAAPDAIPWQRLSLPRLGKNAALNQAVAAARGEVLVFSDADSMLAPDAIRRLVAPLTDPTVGAVGGDFRYAGRGGEGERAYWSFDRLWKRLACRAGSMTSATGQIYAIRAEYVDPVPDGVTDDFFVSTGAIAAGCRLWFAEDAVATGPVAASADAELRRKVRVIGRGLASVWARRALLDPRRTGFYALQLASHKLLRRTLGVPLCALFASALALCATHSFYAGAAAAQAAFHGAAAFGWAARGTRLGRLRPLALPLYADLVLLAGVLALRDLARGRRHRDWVPERAGRLPAISAEERG